MGYCRHPPGRQAVWSTKFVNVITWQRRDVRFWNWYQRVYLLKIFGSSDLEIEVKCSESLVNTNETREQGDVGSWTSVGVFTRRLRLWRDSRDSKCWTCIWYLCPGKPNEMLMQVKEAIRIKSQSKPITFKRRNPLVGQLRKNPSLNLSRRLLHWCKCRGFTTRCKPENTQKSLHISEKNIPWTEERLASQNDGKRKVWRRSLWSEAY